MNPLLHNDEHFSLMLKDDIRKAFELLYNHHFTAVFCFARRFVPERQAAEDITTDSFLKLWNKVNDFTNHSAIRSFLYTTTKNACLNYLRDNRRHSLENQKIILLIEQNDESLLSAEQLNSSIWKHIYDSIENLSPQLKKVFKLAYLEGLSNDEIAAILGINNQSVRNDKARALKQVRLSMLAKNLFALVLLLATIISP